PAHLSAGKRPTRFTTVAQRLVSGRCHKVHQKAHWCVSRQQLLWSDAPPPTPIEQAQAAWYPTNSGSLPPPTPCPPLTAAATALSPTAPAPLSCSPPLLTAAPRR